MKLKAQHVFDATLVVARIIREDRPMPPKGKYRLARLHAKLEPEFQTINARRDVMITAYGFHPMVDGPDGEKVESPNFGVPPDKAAEFNAAWKEIGDEEIEVAVEPVPLACLDLGDNSDGSIQAAEFIVLGDLVTEG